MVEELEVIVNKCVEIMYSSPAFTAVSPADRDHDIVQAYLDPDGGWTVVLLSAYAPERLYMFNKWATRESVAVSIYLRSRTTNIKF